MVLPEARSELRQALSALVAGELSNHRFDDVYSRVCVGSGDRAVAEIGEFGWQLSNAGTFRPFYLTGRYAPADETRAIAERCDLFLGTALEYDWPCEPRLGWVQLVQWLAITPGLNVSLWSLALLPLALYNAAWGGATVIALLPVLTLTPGVWAWRSLSRYESGDGRRIGVLVPKRCGRSFLKQIINERAN